MQTQKRWRVRLKGRVEIVQTKEEACDLQQYLQYAAEGSCVVEYLEPFKSPHAHAHRPPTPSSTFNNHKSTEKGKSRASA